MEWYEFFLHHLDNSIYILILKYGTFIFILSRLISFPNILYYLLSFLVLIFFVCFGILVCRSLELVQLFFPSLSLFSIIFRNFVVASVQTQRPIVQNHLFSWCSVFLFHHHRRDCLKSNDKSTRLGHEGRVSWRLPWLLDSYKL